jgi:hypothetical protein
MIYIDDTGAISATEKPGFLPVIEDEKPTHAADEVVTKGPMIKHADHWQQTWTVVAAVKYTAGEWLEKHGLDGNNQPTLIYLKLQLQAAGKSSTKLTALEQFMQQVLAQFAANNTSRGDWPNPPHGYEETVADCMAVLTS